MLVVTEADLSSVEGAEHSAEDNSETGERALHCCLLVGLAGTIKDSPLPLLKLPLPLVCLLLHRPSVLMPLLLHRVPTSTGFWPSRSPAASKSVSQSLRLLLPPSMSPTQPARRRTKLPL